jgi:hypothetical protein
MAVIAVKGSNCCVGTQLLAFCNRKNNINSKPCVEKIGENFDPDAEGICLYAIVS